MDKRPPPEPVWATCPFCLSVSVATYWPRYCSGIVILKRLQVPFRARRAIGRRGYRIEKDGFALLDQPIHPITRMTPDAVQGN